MNRDQIIAAVRELPKAQGKDWNGCCARKKIFEEITADYCPECGVEDPDCRCWSDE